MNWFLEEWFRTERFKTFNNASPPVVAIPPAKCILIIASKIWLLLGGNQYTIIQMEWSKSFCFFYCVHT